MSSCETYVLCEGYHDRAFWAGTLVHLGCTDPGFQPDGPRVPITDPWKIKVVGGQYAFISPTQRFIRLVPVGGRDKLLSKFKSRLARHEDHQLDVMVLSTDSDRVGNQAGCELRATTFFEAVRAGFPDAREEAAGNVLFDAGKARAHLLTWRTADANAVAGTPHKQTLERILCMALVRAYPERAQPIETWLASRPNPPQPSVKDHAWSHIAGWYGESSSYEAAITQMWQDVKVRPKLIEVLEEAGIWESMQKLAK